MIACYTDPARLSVDCWLFYTICTILKGNFRDWKSWPTPWRRFWLDYAPDTWLAIKFLCHLTLWIFIFFSYYIFFSSHEPDCYRINAGACYIVKSYFAFLLTFVDRSIWFSSAITYFKYKNGDNWTRVAEPWMMDEPLEFHQQNWLQVRPADP